MTIRGRNLRFQGIIPLAVENQSFADWLSTRGQPAEASWRLALVCIFQLTDPGFDFSVLSKFRACVVAGGAEMQLFEVMLECLKTRGLLKAARSSTHRFDPYSGSGTGTHSSRASR